MAELFKYLFYLLFYFQKKIDKNYEHPHYGAILILVIFTNFNIATLLFIIDMVLGTTTILFMKAFSSILIVTLPQIILFYFIFNSSGRREMILAQYNSVDRAKRKQMNIISAIYLLGSIISLITSLVIYNNK